MRNWLFLLLLCFGAPALAASICDQDRLELMPQALLLEDPAAVLTADQVAELPASQFTSISTEHAPYGYSASAFWLRLHLRNDDPWSCQRWLTVGYPHLGDIQVHMKLGDNWQMMRAGSVYPRGLWPVRSHQPIFPLELQAHEKATLLIRVVSQSLHIIEPTLWSELELLGERHVSAMIDGFILGVVLLLVPFSLAVSWILRSRLLVISALSVLSYFLLVCVVNGYLVYWPVLLPWSREAINTLLLLFSTLFLSYLRVLLHVRRLPAIWGQAFTAFLICLTISHFWFWFYDYAQGRLVHDYLAQLGYGLVLVTFLVGVRRRLAYGWVVWLVVSALMLQGLVRLLRPYGALWQIPSESLTLPSTLPALVLLTCTLIMEVSRSRSRETRALEELERQQQAEHDRLESTVSLRTAQLRESLLARSSLMARISHDLRSPLASIVDYARFLQMGATEDYATKIERNARQQLELIDELLELSRSEVQQVESSAVPGYLYGFLREIEDEGRFLAARQRNAFVCTLDPNLPSVTRLDYRRLRRVLINLLGNAGKFTHDGQVQLSVECLARSERTVDLCFSVCDNGIGVPQGEREYLLQPFWRGSNATHFNGTGLGLAIVNQLLRQLNSSLLFDESWPKGSRFSFVLSAELACEEDVESLFVESHSSAANGAGRQILLVDDIGHNLEQLSDLLQGYGFEVEVAESGEQALQWLERQSFDLLVSDQLMPGMDGWALLGLVRSRWPTLPVLLYSASPAIRPATVADDLAFDGSLLKPAPSHALLGRILALLDVRVGAESINEV